MQTTSFNPLSSSLQFSPPWTFPETHLPIATGVPNTLCFRPRTVTRSLRTCYRADDGVDDGPGPSSPVRLPLVLRRSGRVSQYVWDGFSLQLVGFDGGASSVSFDFGDGFRTLYRVSVLAVKDFFIPKNVSEHYVTYVKWKLLHRIFSSALQVIATQAMFRAIGVGHSRSLASAAALNWVLKDGLGRLSRCLFTASIASAFDTNLKRVRFSTAVLFSLGIGVELLTPAFPQYFLLLASIANIVKQISLGCYLSTASAVHRSFAVTDNLGEVSAKAQIQSVCFDNLGLVLAAFLNFLTKNDQRLQAALPFVVYPIFAAMDLFGTYQGLKHVHLQTLTKDRLEIILSNWIERGYVPTPAEVSEREGIDLLCRQGKDSWPIRIGCLNLEAHVPKLSILAMRSVCSKDYYFICMDAFFRGSTTNTHGILLCLREGARAADICIGLLQACFIRKTIVSNTRIWEEEIVKGNEFSDAMAKEWINLVEESKKYAEENGCFVLQQMSSLGWAVKNVLLSTNEQIRYSFVDDP
ncbi:protein root UVB sensitive 4 [Cucumis melo var. makuwa]|uniref:Protein root UVB sensitive 4 n=1 Tax=Cucumis melo var. makuwa TaxID=1194695 RepID=A0A5D3CTG1_CUCMM|nr:protein root UVB sensitive 4 [Cucumis melo var. makuwa]TYK13736.1 protein root UVB sensitive 4 [Cucumis melo var. makuwa]